jgi:hypothetical protein
MVNDTPKLQALCRQPEIPARVSCNSRIFSGDVKNDALNPTAHYTHEWRAMGWQVTAVCYLALRIRTVTLPTVEPRSGCFGTFTPSLFNFHR